MTAGRHRRAPRPARVRAAPTTRVRVARTRLRGARRPAGAVVGDQDMAAGQAQALAAARGGSADLFRPVPVRGGPARPAGVPGAVGVRVGADRGQARVAGGQDLRHAGRAAGRRPRPLGATAGVRAQGHRRPLDRRALLPATTSCRRRHRHVGRVHGLVARPVRRAGQARGHDPEAAAGAVPENKVCPELSGRRALGLFLVAAFIDECQELFSHPDYKDEAARLVRGHHQARPRAGE